MKTEYNKMLETLQKLVKILLPLKQQIYTRI